MPLVVLSRPLWGRFRPSWGLFWGPLRALLGPPGAPGSGNLDFFFDFFVPLLALSWCGLGALLGRLGRLLGRPGAVLDRPGALIGAFWGDLGGLCGRRGRVGNEKHENAKNVRFPKRI